MDPDKLKNCIEAMEAVQRLYERARDEQDTALYVQLVEQVKALQDKLAGLADH